MKIILEDDKLSYTKFLVELKECSLNNQIDRILNVIYQFHWKFL